MDPRPLFPLSHGVFPDGLLQLQIFEVRYLDLIRRCQREGAPFGVPWLTEGHEVQVPGHTPALAAYGCTAEIVDLVEIQPALLAVSCRGLQRFRLLDYNAGPYGVWHGQVEWLPDDAPIAIPPDLQPLADHLGRIIANAQKAGREDNLPLFRPYRLDECGWVANRWAEWLPLTPGDKVELLGCDDPLQRLRNLVGKLGLDD
jgi:Lon protease-like protein